MESGGGYNPIEIPTNYGAVGAPAMAPLMSTTPAPSYAAPSTQAATMAAVNTGTGAAGVQAPGSNALTGANAPQFNPITGEQLNPGFFQQGGALQIGLGALQTLGNLWNSFQQIKLAKDSFKFQKEAWQTNLANQEKTYNTSLENRARSAGTFNGTDRATTDEYIRNHSL